MFEYKVAFFAPFKDFVVICHISVFICEVKAAHCLVMEFYRVQQNVFVIKTYYKYGESVVETVRKCRGEFGRNYAPSITAIAKLLKKFEKIGTVQNSRPPVYHRSGRSPDIAAESESVAESPKTTICHRV